MANEELKSEPDGRRKGDRRKAQLPFDGPDRRSGGDRRSGEDRRATVRVPGNES
ncbi:MAG: hypothetical protein AAFY81_04555 [Pseudomonadota bacterium]